MEDIQKLINIIHNTEASRDENYYNLIEMIKELLEKVAVFELDGILFICPECGEVLMNG